MPPVISKKEHSTCHAYICWKEFFDGAVKASALIAAV